MARSLRLKVLTPAGTLVDEAVAWVQARLADGGTIGIWPRHAPLVAETVNAQVRYADELGEHSLELEAGILHIDPAGVIILTPGRSGVAQPDARPDEYPQGRLAPEAGQ